jgi:hypothetical protein
MSFERERKSSAMAYIGNSEMMQLIFESFDAAKEGQVVGCNCHICRRVFYFDVIPGVHIWACPYCLNKFEMSIKNGLLTIQAMRNKGKDFNVMTLY